MIALWFVCRFTCGAHFVWLSIISLHYLLSDELLLMLVVPHTSCVTLMITKQYFALFMGSAIYIHILTPKTCLTSLWGCLLSVLLPHSCLT